VKMGYKFIHFERAANQTTIQKHPWWWCRSNSSPTTLGTVEWYTLWEQYVFSPSKETVFSADCLLDIVDFISNQVPEYSEPPQ
jgi:hypothetical protein